MNKNALVIGASGGIGLEITRALAAEKITVYGTYFSDKTNLQDLSKTVPNFSMEHMNCADTQSVRTAIAEILKKSGKIDILVYSVTPAINHSPVLKNEWANYQQHLDVQVKGFLESVKCLSAQLTQGYKTKIIVILSEYCVGKPASGISDYIAAKYALMGAAKTLAVELARHNSTVNMISPGMTETDLLSTLPAKAIEFTAMNNPLKRIAKPKDIADAVSFLASDKSDYLNGVNLLVNGGGVMI